MEFHEMYHHDLINANELYEINSLNSLAKIKTRSNRYFKTRCKTADNTTIEVGVYASGSTGTSYIRNAETGDYMNYTVGSANEELFFKVILATGETSTGPLVLFYDSPEHFERHQHVTVSDQKKRAWKLRQQKRFFINKHSSKSKVQKVVAVEESQE